MEKINLIINTNSLYTPLTGIGRYTLNLCKYLSQKKISQNLHSISFHKVILVYNKIPINKARFMKSKFVRPILHLFMFFIRILKIDYIFFLLPYIKYSQINAKKNKSSILKNIYHGTNFYIPFLPDDYKKIVTIHDLSVFKYPHYHPLQRVNEVSGNILNSIKFADLIVTDSLYTKNEIISFFDLPKEKVKFVHLAPDKIFKPLSSRQCIKYLHTYNLEHNCKLVYKRFFLHIGSFEPRKNLLRLIEAYEKIDPKLQKDYPLILIGADGWLDNKFSEKISKNNNIIKLDFIEDSELKFFYNSARAFFYPSLYEGFGLPILESMACKTATFCSDISSMCEIQINKNYRFNPKSIDAIYKLMIKTFDDEFIRICENFCYKQAQKFSWDKVAKEYLKIYQNV